MTDRDEDLRATQASIRRDADRIGDLEDQKAALDPTDPRVDSLSERVEQIAVDIRGKAAAERELAERARPDQDSAGE